MIHVFSLPLNKLNVITLIFILFYRYLVSKHSNLIFKSLFLCEIISLPISTRVTREIKKDEKRRKRETYTGIYTADARSLVLRADTRLTFLRALDAFTIAAGATND